MSRIIFTMFQRNGVYKVLSERKLDNLKEKFKGKEI